MKPISPLFGFVSPPRPKLLDVIKEKPAAIPRLRKEAKNDPELEMAFVVALKSMIEEQAKKELDAQHYDYFKKKIRLSLSPFGVPSPTVNDSVMRKSQTLWSVLADWPEMQKEFAEACLRCCDESEDWGYADRVSAVWGAEFTPYVTPHWVFTHWERILKERQEEHGDNLSRALDFLQPFKGRPELIEKPLTEVFTLFESMSHWNIVTHMGLSKDMPDILRRWGKKRYGALSDSAVNVYGETPALTLYGVMRSHPELCGPIPPKLYGRVGAIYAQKFYLEHVDKEAKEFTALITSTTRGGLFSLGAIDIHDIHRVLHHLSWRSLWSANARRNKEQIQSDLAEYAPLILAEITGAKPKLMSARP